MLWNLVKLTGVADMCMDESYFPFVTAASCWSYAFVCCEAWSHLDDDNTSEIQLLASGYDVDPNELFNPDF